MSKSLFMGSTKIPAEKTALEIMAVLQESGAQQVAVDYGPNKKITAMRFTLAVNGNSWPFTLPVRVDPLLRHCRNDRARAERVAWRQLLRWTQAQLAMIDTGMVKAAEVYSPYAMMPDGKMLCERILAGGSAVAGLIGDGR